ncbi:MAG TPA: hypothetical protein VK508_08420 [Cyclobacteriaceae bacterium]|nr:hypothetical protein [Cyclobacteriaceae bacterium]
MSIHGTVTTRTLTAEFYRVNAMFFLVAMGFCFGFMSGVEHIALAGYFVSSVWLVMIPVGVWIAYTRKVILYNKGEIRTDRNAFLTSLPLLPLPLKVYICLVVAAGQLMPAITYGLFLTGMALKTGQFIIIMIIVPVLIVLIIGVAWSIHSTLVHPEKEAIVSSPVRWLDRRMTKPLAWMFTEGVVRIQPGLIYATKIVTCLIIYGVTQLYLYDTYDARLYSMAACAVFSANLALVYQYHRFEVVHLLLLRSLPLRLSTRIGSFVVTMGVLCFPEIAMLATNLPVALGVQHYFFVIAFGFSLMIFGYGALYVRDATFDAFTRWIFFVGMGWTMLILFGVPLIAGAAVHVALGGYLLTKHLYRFEPNT